MIVRNKLLILLRVGVLTAFILVSVQCHHRPNQQRTLSICDASEESTEECFDKIPDKHPKFLLYKYENLTDGKHVPLSMDIANITHADPYKGSVWKILVHGYLNNANSNFPVNVRDAYVEKCRKTTIKYNILIVDWGELACASFKNAQGYLYNRAAKNTAYVGKELGQLIAFLHNNAFLNLTKDVHIIGHSLGAHVAGQAGREVFDITGKTVRRITGLDPAGPSFFPGKFLPDFVIPKRRLQRKDTQFADIYHTSYFFGSSELMGDVDFWINGGKSQPSCVPKSLSYLWLKDFIQICSHNYATTFYAKTISDGSMHACLCPSYRSYNWGTCRCTDRAVVGEMLDNSTVTVGEYYYNPPRDDSVIETMKFWKDFSIKQMLKQLSDMICKGT